MIVGGNLDQTIMGQLILSDKTTYLLSASKLIVQFSSTIGKI
jgi:hypothetical protein